MPPHPERQRSAPIRWFSNHAANFRHRLAFSDALPQLAILGLVSGIITGVIALLFRLSFELPLHALFEGDSTEAFESLPSMIHFLLPLGGALLVGIILHFIDPHRRQVGVSHVVERVHKHQGRMPSGNAITQFICGSLLLSTGTPVGREGPAVHLGAACASGLGKQMKLPNNNLRLLAGCGVAAAIAASFNTPLAGVIFAMEVVLLEYTVTGFIPIILASVSATVVSRAVYGDDPAFMVPAVELGSLWEIPYLILSGLTIGAVAAVILRMHKLSAKVQQYPILWRTLAAGLIAGTAGWMLPQVLGLGYDTIEMALYSQLGLGLLIAIGLIKILVATTVVGLGLPGGMVSPTLVSGACLGGALGVLGGFMMPELASGPGLYAMLGMAAMMGAVLNAPLAALIALLELTYHPHILMPAMLVIVIACVTARILSRLPGLFLIGHDPDRLSSPVFQMLSRSGVTSLMNRDFVSCSRSIGWEKALAILESKPDWIVIEDVGETKYLLRPSDLAHYLEASDTSLWEEDQPIALLDIPGQHRELKPIHPRASLKEALQLMRHQNAMAIYVSRSTSAPLQSEVSGIITREAIDNYYH
ncbi:chloride channel protein [Porticoccaceae bacterium LTM1]|nr:chloride channel protein [Porticoccaceae bacterium LTM1]